MFEVFDGEAAAEEVEAHLFGIFAVVQADLDVAGTGAGTLEVIFVDGGLENVLDARDFLQVSGLEVGGKARNIPVDNLGSGSGARVISLERGFAGGGAVASQEHLLSGLGFASGQLVVSSGLGFFLLGYVFDRLV